MIGPARIVIFRHAEKPVFETENGLTPRGKWRAELLSGWLIERYHGMKAVYAAGSGPGDLSERKIQTVIPLLVKVLLHVNPALAVNTIHLKSQVKEVAKEIVHHPAFQNQVVLICWTHTHIPELAKELGARNVPGAWPDDRYDLIWEIDVYHQRLIQIPQMLLPGDRASIVPLQP